MQDKIITATKKIIKENQFVFQKKYGQNFLIDEHVLNKIISAAELTKDDCVIEIGPGIGSLTQPLAEAAGSVIAIEIDRMLIPILTEVIKEHDNVELINADFLKTDLHSLINGKSNVKVVANLPYYITTNIIMTILENFPQIKKIVVMVQKEVAQRICAKKGCKEYGSLSIAVEYYGMAKISANVPPNCFMPRPDVSSCVVCIDICNPTRVNANKELLFKIVKAAFSQRRKTLLNCIVNSGLFNLTKLETAEIIKNAGFNENVRGEDLSLHEFELLTTQQLFLINLKT